MSWLFFWDFENAAVSVFWARQHMKGQTDIWWRYLKEIFPFGSKNVIVMIKGYATCVRSQREDQWIVLCEVQGRKELHWMNLMKNDDKGMLFRCHSLYTIEVWMCPTGQGKIEKIHETWSHDPWAESDWANSWCKALVVIWWLEWEQGDCWRSSGKRQVLSRTKGSSYGENLGPQCSLFPPPGKTFPFLPLTKLMLFL